MSDVWGVNYVGADGNVPGIVFSEPEEQKEFDRILLHDPDSAAPSWARSVPHRELEGAESFTPETHGHTWHFRK